MELPSAVAGQGDRADVLLKQAAEPKPAESVPAAPAPPSEPVALTVAAPKAEDWKHKYDVLQGKYNREIRDMQQVMASQNDLVAQLQDTVAQLQARPTQATPSAPAPAASLDASKYENYGEEIVDLVKQVNSLAAERDQLLRQIQSAPAQSAPPPEFAKRIERVERSQDEQFYATLDNLCPQWRELNTSDEFMNWADISDEVLGIKPIQSLRKSYQDRNAQAVSRVFKKFLDISGKPVNPPAPSVVMPNTEGGANPAAAPTGNNLNAHLERVRQAQKDFIQKRITETEYNKIIADYQTALKASSAR